MTDLEHAILSLLRAFSSRRVPAGLVLFGDEGARCAPPHAKTASESGPTSKRLRIERVLPGKRAEGQNSQGGGGVL